MAGNMYPCGTGLPTEWGVALGRVAGVSGIHKRGVNMDVDVATVPETIWMYGGVYTYSATADIVQVSSSSSSDVGVEVTVEGLDANYVEATRVVTLNGQTPVAITALLRVNKSYVSGSQAAVGNVYVGATSTVTAGVPDTASTVRSYIVAGYGSCQCSPYTVPAGKQALLTGWKSCAASNSASGFAHIVIMVREFGKSFRALDGALPTEGGESTDDYTTPIAIPAKADIEARAMSVSNNNTVTRSDYTLVLVTG